MEVLTTFVYLCLICFDLLECMAFILQLTIYHSVFCIVPVKYICWCCKVAPVVSYLKIYHEVLHMQYSYCLALRKFRTLQALGDT